MALSTLPPGPEYREVPDCPGFMAGTDGSLWTCWTMGRWPKRTGRWWRARAHPRPNTGHLLVSLRTASGLRVRDSLHRVILTTFVGPCPDGMIGCHDPDPTPANCALTNLRWATPTDNSADCKKHGRFCAGSRAPKAKLSPEDVTRVFEMRREGRTHGDIAAAFGVARGCITRTLLGTRYRDEAADRTGGMVRATVNNYARGSRSPRAKLTEAQVAEMKRLRAEGWLQKALADRYGVTAPTVCDILNGKYWTHVPAETAPAGGVAPAWSPPGRFTTRTGGEPCR